MEEIDISKMRREYKVQYVTTDDTAILHRHWLDTFAEWFQLAQDVQEAEPNAFVLATRCAQPPFVSTRTVLAKRITSQGIVFFTNYKSQKSRDLTEFPYASITFPWYRCHLQIHFSGSIRLLAKEENDHYWNVRPRSSQLGALSSEQSSPISGRDRLEAKFTETFARYEKEKNVPRPDWWGGYRLEPTLVEFWQGQESRLHNRIRLRREGSAWIGERLQP